MWNEYSPNTKQIWGGGGGMESGKSLFLLAKPLLKANGTSVSGKTVNNGWLTLPKLH